MPYYHAVTTTTEFEQAVEAVKAALSRHGFGVLSEIDVADTLHKKIGETIPPYRILGACNPKMAHKALTSEPHIGVMLPCNVIVRRTDNGETEIAAVDPVASMRAVQNPALASVAEEVRASLNQAIDELVK
ncbi:DUF302 domain-containing protein [Stappia sp. GBMRC 2046]|uniref:DUF302 domain-containing protein n=1 Tax=Stappia sediminis TaxID=2692190 RepID=A0A7X3LSV7_9HYPH|nr:DUF302 domain-containing protein [Stappia sediminis]MXN64478.1 DUF302 domain-containing protein [Stappia sediminis]